MTNFPPETYLAAARIAGYKAEIDNGVVVIVIETADAGKVKTPFFVDSHYRALREALDKEYGIVIKWNEAHNEWLSCSTKPGIHIDGMFNKEIVPLMLENVQALIEAGVVE